MRRNIKFDDERCGLCLEFKLHDEAPCKRLRPDQAKEMQRMEGEVEEVSASDVTSLLSGEPRGEEED